MNFSLKTFSNNNKKIIFIGSRHEKGINEIMSIKSIFDEFNPYISLVEDEFDIADFKTESEAINKGGDMGFISFLAKKRGIKVVSNDPRFEEEFSFIEKRYGRDLSFLYFFLRDRCSMIKSKTFTKYLTDKEIIDYILKKVHYYNYSLDRVKKTFKELFNSEMEERDYSAFFNPTLNINKFNEVTWELNEFRDDYMINKLRELLKENTKIFIIKGEHHLNKSKEKIQKMMQNG